MGLYYFINGQSVTREYMAMYLSQCFRGDPWVLMQRYEEEAMGYFAASGSTRFEDMRIGIVILRAW